MEFTTPFNAYPINMQSPPLLLDSDIFGIYTEGMSNIRKGRGRPPMGSGSAKSESLLLRLAPAEKEGFAEAAALAGVPLSVWIRERLRQVAKKELEAVSRPVAFLDRKAGK
jgi:hypothetical protein